MKTSPKLVLALLAAVSCAAGAETYSSQADQARRERNREEALAHYRAGNTTAREEAHDVADSARRGGHKVAESSRQTGSKNPVEVVLRVKDLAREVGGIKNLKMLVDLLAE